MTNIPPPDRRSSPLGFDEFVGVVVAFAVIGTIFVVSLRPKGGEFNLGASSPKATTTPASPTLGDRLPTTGEAVTPLPQPETVAPATPVPQTAPATLGRLLPVTPFAAAPPVATSSSPEKNQPPAKTISFPDVPQVFWARPYIEALAAQNIISGYQDGTFRPTQLITRAEFAAQLQKAFDQKVVVAAPKYKDIPDKFWASSAIQETTRSGFLRGYPGNKFGPKQKISKTEALVALTKGLDLTNASKPSQVLKIYQDAQKIPKYATAVVAGATEAGLVVNYPNRKILDPNKLITRAEAAALTYQGMVQAGKVPAITSAYVAQPE
jgi:hypothetical protein